MRNKNKKYIILIFLAILLLIMPIFLQNVEAQTQTEKIINGDFQNPTLSYGESVNLNYTTAPIYIWYTEYTIPTDSEIRIIGGDGITIPTNCLYIREPAFGRYVGQSLSFQANHAYVSFDAKIYSAYSCTIQIRFMYTDMTYSDIYNIIVPALASGAPFYDCSVLVTLNPSKTVQNINFWVNEYTDNPTVIDYLIIDNFSVLSSNEIPPDIPPTMTNYYNEGNGVFDANYPHFYGTSTAENSGYATYFFPYEYILSDGEGIMLNMSGLQKGVRAQWYWINGVMRYTTTLQVHSANGEDIYARYYIGHEEGVVINTIQTIWGYNTEGSKSYGIGQVMQYATNPMNYLMWIQRINSTCTIVHYYGILTETGDLTAIPTYIPAFDEVWYHSASFWDSATVTMTVSFEGVGWFNYTYGDFYITSEAPYPSIDLSEPDLHNDWLNTAYGIIKTVYETGIDLFFLAVDMVRTLLPYVPIVIVLYISDVVVTSVYAGSFAPIGAMFMAIWNFILGVYNFIVELAETIFTAIDAIIPL